MADAFLDPAGTRDLIVGTWAEIVPLSPSERGDKEREIGRLLERAAGQFPPPFGSPSEEVDRMLALTGRLTQSGLLELGSANLWPDTPGLLFRGILEEGVLRALGDLDGLDSPSSRAAALEGLLPVPRTHLAIAQFRGTGSLDRDQVESQASDMLRFAGKAWGWSRDNGPEIFPLLLGVTGALVAALLRQPHRTPSTAGEVLWALDTVHYAVDRCADEHRLATGGIAGLEAKVRRAAQATLAALSAPDHAPYDRNEIATRFARNWA
ncbi:hypothetical protein [Mesoterricola silvestris]|uniref:Uncharacterized protein n=1 Tax=Mesoterricola silvestris TaxID=2927979 RepID=A0AA48GR54_9BACT|nr:hypothetical protein [Mesoterricola silvestris]BDU72705.1 hypothetical protein METEAL_18790 [Mesoterricola silvestris]